MTELPESVEQLTRLQQLNLSHNQLTTLPESIGQLTQLQDLAIYSNNLTALSESIGQLTNLTQLNLGGNKLTILPNSIQKLAHLQVLDVCFNQLATLPASIGQLTELEELYIYNNALTTTPASIGQLTELRLLVVNNNALTTLPASIGQLTELRLLLLYDNNLTQLPESIGQLTQLEELDVSNNQLTTLPESLLKLHSLRKLYLHGNDKLGIPLEILGLGAGNHRVPRGEVQPAKPKEILEYYFRILIDRRPLNEAKLILVGRGAVGKTSIVKRLLHNKFDRYEKKTDGIEITEWKLQPQGNEVVRLNIWDFGGQEIMHATHQFFLTQRTLYLLVLNGRAGAEDADAEYWLRIIESFGSDSPVIVVLNKIKEQDFDVNRRGLRQKFTAIRDFIKTDCEDGTGFEALRKAIEQETDRLEHLRDAFPASWFGIKERLSGMTENCLSFDQYREICAELGEEDPAAQEALASHLHNLGIALNYKDDPRLQDTHVLNPHWVTNGIYAILNSEKLAKQKGEIRLRDISGILKPDEYPPKMHLFLFDLMKKFDLCFSFPDDDHHYLIPELLDKQEPEVSAEFKPEECLNFQYHYPVLPEGLLPRFIVSTHTLSEELPRWRTGVILKFEGSRALVKADVQDKKVFILVTGLVPGRRRLLAVIRSDFERIHADIRNLNPEAMVPLPNHPEVAVPYEELLVMEQNGIREFLKIVDNKPVYLKVEDLLNGVDLDRTRTRDRTTDEKGEPVRLFYSYSHKDESLRNELETHLKILQRQGLIATWHDRKIEAGNDWKERIDENLERADIILLLVSADFIASDYCYEKETKRALERHANKEARVIPVIVRDVNWKGAPFADLQALPKDGKAVTKWRDKDSAWQNVSEGIEEVAEEIRSKALRRE